MLKEKVKMVAKRVPFALPLLKWSYMSVLQVPARGKWKKLLSEKSIFLELGSGPKKGQGGWTTVDLYDADICYDLRKGLPLPDNSVDRIYTSHMFEHIPYPQLQLFIGDCLRVLKSGGELSVCVPNARLYIEAYINEKHFKSKSDSYAPALVETGSWIDQVNYVAYMDNEHKYLFDEENLVNTLKLHNFLSVQLRKFDPSLDLEYRDSDSIYASAIK